MCGGWEVIYGASYSLASWECPHCYDTPDLSVSNMDWPAENEGER